MVNTGEPQKRSLIEVEATAYHEGVPGHHLQMSIAQEIPSLPPFRQHVYWGAYMEGWALYAERLGKEVGFYQDPYQEYGRLESEMWRAIRLVVDTGLHYKHWTREQVVQYFHDHSAIDEIRYSRRPTATSRGRDRRCPTKWDSYKSSICALKHSRSSARISIFANSTIRCSIRAHCRWMCLQSRSTAGLHKRRRRYPRSEPAQSGDVYRRVTHPTSLLLQIHFREQSIRAEALSSEEEKTVFASCRLSIAE